MVALLFSLVCDRNPVLDSVPENGTDFGAGFGCHSVTLQAFAAWQWWQYCCGELPAGKAPLRINLDETPVRLFQGGGKGWIFHLSDGEDKKQ